MKAMICTAYGGPELLQWAEWPMPVPKADELLIRVRATTVSSGDVRMRALRLPRGFGPLARPALGFARPRRPVLGTELTGEVHAVGARVARFKPGDAVFAFPGARVGCHAEYRCMAEDDAVAPKPENLTDEQAAALSFGGATALDYLARAGLCEGKRVLVDGASGTVGTAAVQIAVLARGAPPWVPDRGGGAGHPAGPILPPRVAVRSGTDQHQPRCSCGLRLNRPAAGSAADAAAAGRSPTVRGRCLPAAAAARRGSARTSLASRAVHHPWR
jgi:D-arabinose 1-dehydrogenase-like Zn-dependent alcohol dehydrogenase